MVQMRRYESIRELEVAKLNASESKLRDFIVTVYEGRRVPQSLLKAVANALVRVFQGGDLGVALGLAKQRGPREPAPVEYGNVGSMVITKRFASLSYEDAIRAVARQSERLFGHRLSLNTVKSYYARFAKERGIRAEIFPSPAPKTRRYVKSNKRR